MNLSGWVARHPRRSASAAIVVTLLGLWGWKLTQVAASVDRYAQHWSQPQGEPGGLVYVALGDSAAQGIGASSPEHGYVGILADRLRERTGQPVQVVNLSTSGAVVADVLDEQLPALLELGLRADVLTVGIGGNDLLSYDADRFATQVERLVTSLPDGAYFADAPWYMHGGWERDAAGAAKLMTGLAQQAGLRPVPLHERMRAQGWQSMGTQFAADWFHPNDRGHRVWADAFWSVLEPDLPAR